MSKTLMIVLACIFIPVVLLGSCSVSGYNGMVGSQETVTQTVGDINTAEQRRFDLIPSLVETVKGYASHEKGTLESVMAARASATQIKLDPKDMSPEKMKQYQAAQGQFSAALGRLMMVKEQYPNLKADKHFSDLMIQLEGTENRIKVARDKYNAAVKDFNVRITTFPGNIVNGMFLHATRFESFKADEGAKVAPKVKF